MIEIQEPETDRINEGYNFNQLDKLDTKTLVQKLITHLSYADTNDAKQFYSTCVGMVSTAGSGKSFFLNLLYNEILHLREEEFNQRREPSFDVLYIDIANYQNIPDIFLLITAMLLENFDGNQKVKDFFFSFFNTTENIISVLPDIVPGLNSSKKIISYLKNLSASNNTETVVTYSSYDNFIFRLKKILENEKQVIVIIDNLEKCSPEYTVNFFFQMKRLFELRQYTFILAYDKKEVQTTLKTFYGDQFNTLSFFRKYIFHEYYLDKYYDTLNDYIDSIIDTSIIRYNTSQNNLFSNNLDRNNFIESLKNIYKKYNEINPNNFTIRILSLLIQKFIMLQAIYNTLNPIATLYIVSLKFLDEEMYEYLHESRLLNIYDQVSNLNELIQALDENGKNIKTMENLYIAYQSLIIHSSAEERSDIYYAEINEVLQYSELTF